MYLFLLVSVQRLARWWMQEAGDVEAGWAPCVQWEKEEGVSNRHLVPMARAVRVVPQSAVAFDELSFSAKSGGC